MATETLATQLDIERAEAIQHLLHTPMLNVASDAGAYTLVSRHSSWLVDWFDTTCGWALHVDAGAGFARLAKRHAGPDTTRPLRRPRGARAPFDRRRYQLLCLVAAELVSHPVTTVGLLAQAVASSADFAADKHPDRVAFVDALLVLRSWQAVNVTSGEVEDFAGNEHANALLVADLARLHRLIDSATAPSNIDPGCGFDEAVGTLLAEPRYGSGGQVDAGDPYRWTRHHLARRLLDDPVVHLDDCTQDELAYLSSGAGRTWLRARVADAGLLLEERVDGLLVIDPTARSTDDTFPAPNGTVHQMALLLLDQLVEPVPQDDGPTVRRPRTRSLAELVAAVAEQLAAHPSWAKAYQDQDGDHGGAERLAAESVALLASFGLVRASGTTIEARPAVCRYRPKNDDLESPTEPAPALF